MVLVPASLILLLLRKPWKGRPLSVSQSILVQFLEFFQQYYMVKGSWWTDCNAGFFLPVI
ncbi:hypothetical protein SAY86_021829 [Trapa natans]|uniref:Uncharacterized protein n=1 Tax=Trapa natans TaxID=22666 RepID=A0AAN7MAM1_TRANT|nr:hypothetical protein SAY86_021829 [Trapa natans]